jgi:F0F1-type ATP synthase assembly protein I
MNKQLISFHLYLFIALGGSYFIHDYIVGYDHLILLYALNLSAACFVYWLVFFLRDKQKEYLGFYFLLGTLIKFFVFFKIVLPIFKDNDIVSKTEFLSFFIPYLLSLFVETKSLISLLNTPNK